MTVHGDCFHVALLLVMGSPPDWDDDNRMEPTLPGGMIVHGLPIGTGGLPMGKRFWHAWVEATIEGERVCVDFSNGRRAVLERSRFYAIGQIDQVYRYNRHQAAAMYRKHSHSGPWVTGWETMGDIHLEEVDA